MGSDAGVEAGAKASVGSAAKRRRKLPMAVGVVSLLIGLVAVLTGILGVFLLWTYGQCGAFTRATLLQPFEAVVCRPLPPVPLRLTLITPAIDGLDALYYLLTGIVLLVLLYGFRRLRPWAWLGIMGWSGLNLAVAIYRYFMVPTGQVNRLVMMALNVVIVLALNMEEVQRAFGLRKSAEDRPRRPAAPHEGVEP